MNDDDIRNFEVQYLQLDVQKLGSKWFKLKHKR